MTGGVVLPLNFSLSEKFLRKSIGWKGFSPLKLRKHGCTKEINVVSECILKCNFFMKTNVLYE